MMLAIHRLLQQRPLNQQAIHEFLSTHTFPIVEGQQSTFIYHGDADEVFLRHWIYALPSAPAFTRIPNSKLWFLVLDLPRGSRVEYKIEVQRGSRREWILDPLNPLLAHDPFGTNSVCHGIGYTSPDWIEADPEARPGTLVQHEIEHTAFGDRRHVTVYLPVRYRTSRRYPLLIVHDGGDYLNYTQMKTVLDNLIHRFEVQPMIVAFTHPVDRLKEYPNYPAHIKFIADQLVPYLESRYSLYTQPQWRGLMGASFGGVASLSVAWNRPGIFGKLFLQSGSFVFTDIGHHNHGPEFDPVVKFVNDFREKPGRPSDQIFLSCGTYEPLIYENRSMLPLLRDTGMRVRYVETPDGHNWENWRDRMREGLSWLFPGPLLMVYE